MYPSYYTGSFPHAMREAYVREWHKENDPQIAQMPLEETITFRGPDFDDARAAPDDVLRRGAHAEAGGGGRDVRP